MTSQATGPSRRTLLKLAAAVPALLPFLRPTQPASAAAARAIGLVSAHPVGKTKLYQVKTSANSTLGLFVTRTARGTWSAFANICTHEGVKVSLQSQTRAFCPAHGAVFNPKTGQPISGPARFPLAAYSVSVRKGKIYVTV